MDMFFFEWLKSISEIIEKNHKIGHKSIEIITYASKFHRMKGIHQLHGTEYSQFQSWE